MAENPILIDKKDDKRTLLLEPQQSLRAPGRPALLRTRRFGTRIEKVPDDVYGKVFENLSLIFLCLYFNINCN